MAKMPEKQLSPERKDLISKLIEEFGIKSMKDIFNGEIVAWAISPSIRIQHRPQRP